MYRKGEGLPQAECLVELVELWGSYHPATGDAGRDAEIDMAFDYAGRTNSLPLIMRFLRDQGAEINAADIEGFTPLLWTIRYDAEDIARYLYTAGRASSPSTPGGIICCIWRRTVLRLLSCAI